jgi:hypothetical protein
MVALLLDKVQRIDVGCREAFLIKDESSVVSGLVKLFAGWLAGWLAGWKNLDLLLAPTL